jgi:hypothetical protein
LGAALADLGTGEGVPGGGGYVKIWSDIGTALENNQAVANLMGKIAQQVKFNDGNVVTAMAKANQKNADVGALKTQLVGIYQTQRSEEETLTQMNGQLYHLTKIFDQAQQEFRQHNVAPQLFPGAAPPRKWTFDGAWYTGEG